MPRNTEERTLRIRKAGAPYMSGNRPAREKHGAAAKKPGGKALLIALALAALTAIGAFIRIPTAWVSFTLQIFFTFLAGILLGPGWGALSQLIYVLLGLIGVPVFTEGGGFGYVFHVTFGFLLGLIPCAAVTGALARGKGKRGLLRLILACVAGLAVLYAVGLPYMAWVLNVHLEKGLSTGTILKSGMLIFLPWDALKIAAAVVLSKALLPVVEREMR